MHTSLNVVNCFLHGEESQQGNSKENNHTNTLRRAKDTVPLGGKKVMAVIPFVHLGNGLIDVIVLLDGLVAFATGLVVALVLVHVF